MAVLLPPMSVVGCLLIAGLLPSSLRGEDRHGPALGEEVSQALELRGRKVLPRRSEDEGVASG